MNKILVSLNCSGESFEKTITLYYFAYLSNPDFYNQYKVQLYYGHNLPKKDKNINAHGTVGFYEKYYSNLEYFPPCSKNYFIQNKVCILNMLLEDSHISKRACRNLLKNDNLYWNYLKKIPFEYIYPDFINKIKQVFIKKFNLYDITPLFLEKKYLEIVTNIKKEKERYSIYGLNYNGNIGRYYLNCEFKETLNHLLKSIQLNSVLSGNSAVFLYQISNRNTNNNIIFGYREHKRFVRPNRDFSLKLLLKGKQTVIEPKNSKINDYFNGIDINLSEEERANIVYAKAYLMVIKDIMLFKEEREYDGCA